MDEAKTVEELRGQIENAPLAEEVFGDEDEPRSGQPPIASSGGSTDEAAHLRGKPKPPTHDVLRDKLLDDGVLYAYGLGEWRRYDRGTWAATQELTVKDHASKIVEQAKPLGLKPTLSVVNSVAGLAQMRVAVPDEEWDADPDLLVCGNGTCHIPTRTLLPHSPDHRATSAVPYDYDPAAQAPTWLGFLSDRFAPGVGAFLQEFAGYCLSTDVSHEIAVWLHGPPGGGRSTLIMGLQAMLGARAGVLGLRAIERSRFALAEIPGKTLLVATEQPAGYTESTDILNALISGDKMEVERKYRDAYYVYPKAKLLWAMNALPRVADPNDGLFRRIHVIDMEPIPLSQRDPQIKERIKTEGAGIFNWAVEGRVRLNARGRFEVPGAVRAATEDYRATNDVPAAFVADVCATDPDLSERAHPLYEAYRRWCLATGHRPQSETSMAKEWQRLGYEKYASGGRSRYRGISVRLDALEELGEGR
jgi:putative DNA primase/helicase